MNTQIEISNVKEDEKYKGAYASIFKIFYCNNINITYIKHKVF